MTQPGGDPDWLVRDDGAERVLVVNGKEHRTRYSRRLVELIVARKGPARATQYLAHRQGREAYLAPLFQRLNGSVHSLNVLEVGCSAGHITEYLNEQPAVGSIVSFDVDAAFVEIARLRAEELGLSKVRSIDRLSSPQTRPLPYPGKSFDLVIVMAVVEHLPPECRWMHVDEYYRVAKTGGLVGFWDTPNRSYPFETHSIGLPGVQWLSPKAAFLYARLFKRSMRGVTFPQFMRAGTGWRNASYEDLLPKALMVDVADVSEEMGYGCTSRWVRRAQKVLRIPQQFFTPWLNVVLRVTKDYEDDSQ